MIPTAIRSRGWLAELKQFASRLFTWCSTSDEDRADIEEAERRLADRENPPVPYDHVRQELGLDT